jgi:tetratricopeptide (TPR) repeat protein
VEAKQSKNRVMDLLLCAGDHYLKSLNVCDRLVGELSDRELLEMRSRLYLNLGLVYEDQGDIDSAKRFIEKALGVVRYRSAHTVYLTHDDAVRPNLACK